MKNVVTKINMGLFPNNCTNYLAPHLIVPLINMMVSLHQLDMSSCD